jgi:hypothetical protein
MKYRNSNFKKATIQICLLNVFAVALSFTSCSQSNTKEQQKSSDSIKMESSSSLVAADTQNMPQAKEIVSNQKSRVRDAYGSGQYGASRDAGVRTHNGIDIIVAPGEKIFSPIKGDIVRQAMPYRDDPNYKGIVLKGVDDWDGYELKIFYVEGLFSGRANETQEIGSAQNLTLRYPTITNHIHLEVRYLGILVDPFTIWQYSF